MKPKTLNPSRHEAPCECTDHMSMKPTLSPNHKINIKIRSGCTWQEQKMVLSESALQPGHTVFLKLKPLCKDTHIQYYKTWEEKMTMSESQQMQQTAGELVTGQVRSLQKEITLGLKSVPHLLLFQCTHNTQHSLWPHL